MHKQFLPDNFKHDLYLMVSYLNQGCLSVEEYICGFEQLEIRSGLEEEGEDDGGPSIEPTLDPQGSQGSSSSSSKVNKKVLTLLNHISIQPRLGSMHKINYVHLWEQSQKG